MAPEGSARANTIFALSSGAPPAAIAIIRISGPHAGATLSAMANELPPPRQARLRIVRSVANDPLDRALVLWSPGPASATGEDLAELHLHGGRAVVTAVLDDLTRRGLRLAEPGEFTRRALFNGRLDLAEVEGLADLLAAETEAQRREALARSGGALSRRLEQWAERLLDAAAAIEAAIDYDGEEEVVGGESAAAMIDALAADIRAALAAPPVERLRDGLRVVIIGPPNAGKSSLFNAILGQDAAIVSPIAGTTRDAIERPVAIAGMPFVLVDTAGLRDADDPVERIGVERARAAELAADIVIDLGPAYDRTAPNRIFVSAKADLMPVAPDTIPTSALDGTGLAALVDAIAALGQTLLPREGEVGLGRRYREGLAAGLVELDRAQESGDMLFIAEHLRHAREQVDRLTGRADVEAMLDRLFGRFCLGK